MNDISQNLEAALAIISGDGFAQEILQQEIVAAERTKLKDLLAQLEHEADTKFQKELCSDIARHNLMFMDAFEVEAETVKRQQRLAKIFEDAVLVPAGEDDNDDDDDDTGYEGSRIPGTKQYDPNLFSPGTNQASQNASFVGLLGSDNNIGEEKDRYYPYNPTLQATSLGAEHLDCFAETGSPGGRQDQPMEYPTTARASQATPMTRSNPLPEAANAIEEDNPTTPRTGVLVPFHPNVNSKNMEPARRNKNKKAGVRKPPGAKPLDQLEHIARSTNTRSYTISSFDLQLFQPEGDGRALWVGKIKSEKKGRLAVTNASEPTIEENVRFADFVKQETFKRRFSRQITKSKQTDKTYNDDPWYQDINAYLKQLNFERANHGLPEVLVSFVKWTEKHKNSHKVKWEHRTDHRVLVLLRNQDGTIHKVQMFDGRYLLEFNNFQSMEDNLGANQVHSCWYKEDYR